MTSRLCTITDCRNTYVAKGLCAKHYARKLRTGSTDRAIQMNAGKTCAADDCNSQAKVKGLCQLHYQRKQNTGRLHLVYPLHETCTIDGCDRPHLARGYCNGHYSRWQQHGDVRADVPLRTPGKGSINKDGYVVVGKGARGKHIFEHRVIMQEMLGRDLYPGETVHHKNGVRHDNRPENLELWVKSQPAGQRVEDVVLHAVAMLQRYSPGSLAA